MKEQKRVLVTGAGGFIGHHLVKRLKTSGYWVRGVDLKYPDYEASPADVFEILDLRRWDSCLMATRGDYRRGLQFGSRHGGHWIYYGVPCRYCSQ